MWILHFLPDTAILWAVNLILLLGVILAVAGLFAHRIPVIWQYQLPFKIAGIVLLALGVYFRGGYAVETEWRQRVAELEKQVAEAEAKSAKVNVEVQTRVIEKTRVVREKGEEIIKYIDKWNTKEVIKEVEGPERIKREEVIKYIENCPMPAAVIDAHNAAAILNRAAQGEKK
jgi:hypothetical protein